MITMTCEWLCVCKCGYVNVHCNSIYGTGFTCDISVLYHYLDLYMVSVWIPVFLISVILCDICDICVVPV